MYRRLTVLLVVAGLALMPFAASAQTTHRFNVQATGQPATNAYFETSEMCGTAGDDVTFLRRGGPTFSASGISPASGGAFESLTAVGGSAFGNAYFFGATETDAFQFWFEGRLYCRTSAAGSMNFYFSGQWTDGFAYSQDPDTGQLLCTELIGSGNVQMYADFVKETTRTVVNGTYTMGETQPCVI